MPGSNDPPAALIGGLTALLALLTAIATVNGTVTRMFRNFGGWIYVALFVVLVAFLCGLLAQIFTGQLRRVVIIAGTVMLFVGFSTAVYFQVKSTSLSERPSIKATTTERSGAIELDAEVTASGAKAEAQLLVVVFGVPVKADNAGDTPTLYYAKTGPDPDGKLRQDVQVFLPIGLYDVVRVDTAIYDAGKDAATVDCDGQVLDDNGHVALDAETDQPIKVASDRTACLGMNLERTATTTTAKATKAAKKK